MSLIVFLILMLTPTLLGEKRRLLLLAYHKTMLIRVVYSDNRILLCNADCLAVNLLNYVRKQTENLDREVDVADETGKPLCT